MIFDDRTNEEKVAEFWTFEKRSHAYPEAFEGWALYFSIGGAYGLAFGTIGGPSYGGGFTGLGIVSIHDGHPRYGRSELSPSGLSGKGFGFGLDVSTGVMFIENWTKDIPSPWWGD